MLMIVRMKVFRILVVRKDMGRQDFCFSAVSPLTIVVIQKEDSPFYIGFFPEYKIPTEI